MQEARTMALPMVCWVWPMHQTMVAGLALAIISATFSSCSGVTPVASWTVLGSHLAITSSRTFSMP